MNKKLTLSLLLLAFTTTSWGQTSTDLNKKYRKITFYELQQPGIVMIPKYADDGNVCEMTVERHQATDNGIILALTFSDQEVKDVIDELVPEPQRGRDLKDSYWEKWLRTTLSGSTTDTEFSYENISVHAYGTVQPEISGNMIIVIKWLKRVCQ